jgi:hypothetical protein
LGPTLIRHYIFGEKRRFKEKRHFGEKVEGNAKMFIKGYPGRLGANPGSFRF